MDTLRNLYCWMVAKLSCEKGQTVIEYVLIIVLASLVLMAAFMTDDIGSAVTDRSLDIANDIAP